MKTYKYLYQKMLDKDLIKEAYRNLRKGKTKRKEIRYIDRHLDSEILKIQLMIKNTRPCKVENPELAYKPIYHTPKIINEHGKQRIIFMPCIHEQWLHHIIILVFKPIILATSHKNVCGSFPNRGAHYGKKKIEKWTSKPKGLTYYAKLDICHFYNNIRHDVLFKELKRRIKDDWFLYIIKICLAQFKKGLPLGYYISQWLANYLLEPLDVYVSSRFKKYVRYMDDIVFFNTSKIKLGRMMKRIKLMLKNRFRLKLKRNYQIVMFGNSRIGRPLDFMGFVFYRHRTIIRKSIMLSACKLARKIYKRSVHGLKVYKKWIHGMVSYNGWFKSTDSYNCYIKRIKPYIRIGLLKKLISIADRRTNGDRLERNKNIESARSINGNRSWFIYAS